VLATRSTCWPNPIGITVAEILKIEGNRIKVIGLDALNGMPILNIKPYEEHFDSSVGIEREPGIEWTIETDECDFLETKKYYVSETLTHSAVRLISQQLCKYFPERIMSLLSEIQADALDSKVDVTDLLRKCLVLATRLGNDDFQRWVSQELNGYQDNSDLPLYRVIETNSYGQFTNGYSMLQNYSIPSFTIPEEYLEATTMRLMQPISSLAHMVKNAKEDTLQFPWSVDLIAIMRDRVYEGFSCLAAFNVVSVSRIAGIIDTVRNRILEFVLKIENEAPDAGEALPGAQPIPFETVQQLFKIYVLGDVGNLALGGSDVTQFMHQDVYKGDLESLKKYLLDLGFDLEGSDLEELEGALENDKIDGTQKNIGSRTKEWIDKMKSKVSTGAGAVGVSVATELISKGIEMYLGLHSS